MVGPLTFGLRIKHFSLLYGFLFLLTKEKQVFFYPLSGPHQISYKFPSFQVKINKYSPANPQ